MALRCCALPEWACVASILTRRNHKQDDCLSGPRFRAVWCHVLPKTAAFGNKESASKGPILARRQCDLYRAATTAQWVSSVMLIITVRRAWSSALASTRIFCRRTAPYPPFCISNHVPYGFTQDPSTDRIIIVRRAWPWMDASTAPGGRCLSLPTTTRTACAESTAMASPHAGTNTR